MPISEDRLAKTELDKKAWRGKAEWKRIWGWTIKNEEHERQSSFERENYFNFGQ